MPKTAVRHTHTACPLRIKHVGHAHHRPHGALHEYIRQVSALMHAMFAQRQVDRAQRVHHSPLVRVHVVLPGWLDVGHALGAYGWVGVPCRRGAMSSAASRSTAVARASGRRLSKKSSRPCPSAPGAPAGGSAARGGPYASAPRPAAASGRSPPGIVCGGVTHGCAFCPFFVS